MNIKLLKESIRKQCQTNHETVIATQTLRRFNNENNIIEAMRVPNKKAS